VNDVSANFNLWLQRSTSISFDQKKPISLTSTVLVDYYSGLAIYDASANDQALCLLLLLVFPAALSTALRTFGAKESLCFAARYNSHAPYRWRGAGTPKTVLIAMREQYVLQISLFHPHGITRHTWQELDQFCLRAKYLVVTES